MTTVQLLFKHWSNARGPKTFIVRIPNGTSTTDAEAAGRQRKCATSHTLRMHELIALVLHSCPECVVSAGVRAAPARSYGARFARRSGATASGRVCSSTTAARRRTRHSRQRAAAGDVICSGRSKAHTSAEAISCAQPQRPAGGDNKPHGTNDVRDTPNSR